MKDTTSNRLAKLAWHGVIARIWKSASKFSFFKECCGASASSSDPCPLKLKLRRRARNLAQSCQHMKYNLCTLPQRPHELPSNCFHSSSHPKHVFMSQFSKRPACMAASLVICQLADGRQAIPRTSKACFMSSHWLLVTARYQWLDAAMLRQVASQLQQVASEQKSCNVRQAGFL